MCGLNQSPALGSEITKELCGVVQPEFNGALPPGGAGKP